MPEALPPERLEPSLADAEREREAMLYAAAEQHEEQAMAVGAPLLHQTLQMAEDPEAVQSRADFVLGEQVPTLYNDVAAKYAPIFGDPEWHGLVMKSLNAHPNMAADVEAILEGVVTPVDPADGVVPHRYLNTQKGKNDIVWYRLNKKALDNDITMINAIKSSNPDLAPELEIISQALDECLLHHPDLPIDAWGTKNQHISQGERRTRAMLKLPAVLALVAATTITGIAAIANKRGFGVPLLYAALAGFVANPNLRKTIFGSTNEQVIAQVDSTMNNPRFRTILSVYGISGAAWADHAEDIMSTSREAPDFVDALKRETNEEKRQEMIDEYLSNTITDPNAQDSLRRMIESGDYGSFVAHLRGVRDKDTQDVVLTFINEGGIDFDGVAKMNAKDAQKAFEQHAAKHPAPGFMNPQNPTI